MEQKKLSKDIYFRNVPIEIIELLKDYSKHKRTTLAGVLIELVEFSVASGLLEIKDGSYIRSN